MTLITLARPIRIVADGSVVTTTAMITSELLDVDTYLPFEPVLVFAISDETIGSMRRQIEPIPVRLATANIVSIQGGIQSW